MKRISCVLIGLIILFPCFLKAQFNTNKLWQRGGESPGNYIAFSPDSLEMIVSGAHESLVIVNSATGEEIRELGIVIPFEHWSQSQIQLVAWSVRDEIAVINKSTLTVLKGNLGNITGTFTVSGQIDDLEKIYFSPSGNYLLGQGNGNNDFKTLRVWDSDSYSEIIPEFEFDRLYVLPGDTTVLVEKGPNLEVRTFPNGELLRDFKNIKGHQFFGFADIQIGKNNYAGAARHDTLFIFNYASGEIIQHITDSQMDGSFRFSFTPDNKKIISTSTAQGLQVRDIETGDKIQTIQYITGEVDVLHNTTVFLSHTGSLRNGCYPSGYDNMAAYSVIDVIDLKMQWVYNLGNYLAMSRMRFSEDGSEFFTFTADSTQMTWESSSGNVLKREKASSLPAVSDPLISPTGAYRLKFSPNRSKLELWNNTTDTFIRNLSSSYVHHGAVFTPNEKFVLASPEEFYGGMGGAGGEVRIVEVSTGTQTAKFLVGCYLSSIVVSPDNRFIATVANDGSFTMYSGEGLLTSVGIPQTENLLKTTIYPNPLQESGTISYSVSTPGLLKISVHDIFGREMMVVKNEFSEPGKYTIPFKSSEFSNGTYFLKVMGGSETSTTYFSILR